MAVGKPSKPPKENPIRKSECHQPSICPGFPSIPKQHSFEGTFKETPNVWMVKFCLWLLIDFLPEWV
jgi:hypothetical protein